MKCRFCRVGNLREKYPSNEDHKEYGESNLFTCTNCGFGQHGSIVECQSCGIIYVDEKTSQEKISTYYEVSQDPLYFAQQEARKITFGHYLKRLNTVFPAKGKLLDIGTNTGLFVRLALDNGWQATGLEPNRWATEFAKKNYSINLINKPFEKNVFPKESFDVITMWDVIEHFVDPIEELEKIYWFLKEGGVFAFSTVDPGSFFAKSMGTRWSWYMTMHRVFFTRKSAATYLEKIGFKEIIFKPHWRYLSLGYLSSRLIAINPRLSQMAAGAVKNLGLSETIVPYYANDLYDCYAFK